MLLCASVEPIEDNNAVIHSVLLHQPITSHNDEEVGYEEGDSQQHKTWT